MTDDSYRKALNDLKAERDKWIAEREDIDQRLARIDAAIANLAVVIDNEPFIGGLAGACRLVLQRAGGRPMVPTEVRDGLKAIGYDLSKHTNIMASVHSVLRRLSETPEVELVYKQEHGATYRWKGNAAVPSLYAQLAKEIGYSAGSIGDIMAEAERRKALLEQLMRQATLDDVQVSTKSLQTFKTVGEALAEQFKSTGAPKKK